MSTEFTGSDHAHAIEEARLAYVRSIRDNRSDEEISVAKKALQRAVADATGAADVTIAVHDGDTRTVFDVVTAKALLEALTTSIRQALTTAYGLAGEQMNELALERLARELARNAAQAVLGLPLDKR